MLASSTNLFHMHLFTSTYFKRISFSDRHFEKSHLFGFSHTETHTHAYRAELTLFLSRSFFHSYSVQIFYLSSNFQSFFFSLLYLTKDLQPTQQTQTIRCLCLVNLCWIIFRKFPWFLYATSHSPSLFFSMNIYIFNIRVSHPDQPHGSRHTMYVLMKCLTQK